MFNLIYASLIKVIGARIIGQILENNRVIAMLHKLIPIAVIIRIVSKNISWKSE